MTYTGPDKGQDLHPRTAWKNPTKPEEQEQPQSPQSDPQSGPADADTTEQGADDTVPNTEDSAEVGE